MYKKVKTVKLVLSVIMVLSMTSCVSWFHRSTEINGPRIVAENVRLEEATGYLKDNNEKIIEIGTDITEKADKITKKDPTIREASEIKSGAEKVNLLARQNLAVTEKLQILGDILEKKDDEIRQLEEANRQWESETFRKQKQVWNLIMSGAGIGMVIGIFLVVTGYSPKTGFSIVAGSDATASMAYFMVSYAHIIAIMGGVFLLLAMLYVVYNAWKDKQAVKESVMSLELAKNKEWNNVLVNKVDRIQSDSTKVRVQGVKEELKKQGYYVMPNEDQTEQKVPDFS